MPPSSNTSINNKPNDNTVLRNVILGALVADAAALGLHWIYDQDHIRAVVDGNFESGGQPEFRTPDAANYENVPGFFAHANKSKTSQSQYGTQILIMLRSLVATKGTFNLENFRGQYRAAFGYGGTYVGYIDHATRETLDNMKRAEDKAMERARAVPFSNSQNRSPDYVATLTTTMITKVQSVLQKYATIGEESFSSKQRQLNQDFEGTVRVTHDDDEVVQFGFAILTAMQSAEAPQGASDVQLPGIAKLPPLIAALLLNNSNSSSSDDMDATVETAVRATAHHDAAVAYGQTMARTVVAAAQGQSVDEILHVARTSAQEFTTVEGAKDMADDLELAISTTMKEKSVEQVTKHFGMACNLSYALPSVVHNVQTSPSFVDAVRSNIYAGGDSCGRGVLLGAIMGAVHGVGGDHGIPQAWIHHLECHEEAVDLVDRLLLQ